MCAQSTHVCLRRRLKHFCSPDDASSCTHYQRNQTCPAHHKIPSNLPKSQHSIHGKIDTNVGAHSRRKPTFSEPPPSHDTFTIPPSTNTQSAPLPLRPVETRARSERGHRPCCSFWGTRRVISLCLRTEPSYSTTRSSNLIDLPKKLHDRFLQVPFVDMRWWELGLEGLPSLSRMSPGLPAQLLHPHHSPTGRARLVQPTTTRRESRRTRPDRTSRSILWRGKSR